MRAPHPMQSLVITLACLLVSGVCAIEIVLDTPRRASTQTVAPMPPPEHVEWEEHEVGGLVLLNPAVRDTLGRPTYIVIPPGSMLEIPHWVHGQSDEEKQKSVTKS